MVALYFPPRQSCHSFLQVAPFRFLFCCAIEQIVPNVHEVTIWQCFVLSSSFRFSDGRTYEGEWVSGRREGYGEMRGRPEDGKHPDEWTFYAGIHRDGLKKWAPGCEKFSGKLRQRW